MITTYDVHDIFAQLPSGIFSIPGWFISGGSAVYHNATDIDIYFTTEASFNAVNKLCISTYKHSHTTDNAITYTTKPNPFGSVRSKPIQLVKRQFVPIPLMLADFDLNVCRKAIRTMTDRIIGSCATSWPNARLRNWPRSLPTE